LIFLACGEFIINELVIPSRINISLVDSSSVNIIPFLPRNVTAAVIGGRVLAVGIVKNPPNGNISRIPNSEASLPTKHINKKII
jgi:hypothetical protein